MLLAPAWLAVAAILYYGVIFSGSLPDHRWLRGYNDWLLHAMAFFALSLPLLPICRGWVVLLGLTLLAATVEVAQFWMPRRNPGLDDVLAGVFGVLVGIILVRMGRWLFNPSGRAVQREETPR